MADATTVVEGKIKYREGRKWKPRWCVLKKSSPVADRLQLILYKDVHEALRVGGKVKTTFPLEGYCGLESGFVVDRESNVLAILCQKQVTLLAFETREYLIQFEVKIRRSVGQDYQYPVRLVKVPAGSRLPLEGVKLLIHGTQFCMTAHIPPRILQSWNVPDLRRYGSLDGKFCFEGGSRCGKGAGVHAVQTDQADEISEVLRMNSLGKSSAASRAASYRSSQILEYSLANADCSTPRDDNPGTPGSESGASAVGDGGTPNLMCCHGLPAGGQGDEWGCRKRHSVGFTEFHRASVATFQGKLPQTSIENQERQHGITVCDIQPKCSHKLDTASCPNTVDSLGFPDSLMEGVSAASSATSLSCMGAVPSSGQSRLVPCSTTLGSETRGSWVESEYGLAASQRRQAGRGTGALRSLDTSVFDSMVNAQVDTTKRMEALQTLYKQESNLQQEMVLLDQMLQSCHHGDDDDIQTDGGNEIATLNIELRQDKIKTLESPSRCSIPAHIAAKASSLPPKINGKDAELNMSPVQNPMTFADTPDQASVRDSKVFAHSPLRPQVMSYMEVPKPSHLNTPLPYVNLTKYDTEMDSGFVYIHGGRNSDSGCVTVPPKLHRNPAGGSLASLGNIVGVMPTRCSSETRMPSETLLGNQNYHAPQKPLPLPPKEDSDGESCFLDDDLAISTERLDDDVLLPPTTYAPPVPYPRLLTTTPSATSATEVSMSSHVCSPALPPPAPCLKAWEHFYVNEAPPLPPPREKQDTPPPELPPKGPALLRRSKLLSTSAGSHFSSVPPAPPVRTRSLSVGSEGKFYDYDNPPPANRPPMPLPETAQRRPVEDTYLPMGSPKNTAYRSHNPGRREGESSRPSSLYVSGSPRPRNKGLSAASRRGNADVLSGYMDMANMFTEEPKPDLSSTLKILGRDTMDTKEVHISEPVVDSNSDAVTSPESNYMEMSSLPPPYRRKSTVLKNLEALQTFVSATTSGETPTKPRSRSSTPTPPNISNKPTTPTSSQPVATNKSSCKIYTRISSCSAGFSEKTGSPGKSVKAESCFEDLDNSRPAIPFTNLKNFEQKHSKPSYVNTCIPAPDVPLPEPPKKEEGFFARLIRRNSKDKSASQSQENLNHQKNRTSVFERTMSVHIQGHTGEEKTTSKLKIGRRRSASFPNRLSFQETSGPGSTNNSTPSKKDTTPPLPPSIKSSNSVKSSSTKSSSSIKSIFKPTTPPPQLGLTKSQQGSRSGSSSVQDLSDDSDMAPLLRRGRNSCSQSDMTVLTVLHVQPDPIVNPMANMYADLSLCSSSHLSSKLSDTPSTTCNSSCSTTDCTKTLTDSSKTLLSSSSKTDDEKLLELFEHSKQQTVLSDVKSKMSLPLERQSQRMNTTASQDAATAPQIPPKWKQQAQPLTPVSEVSSLGGLSLSTPSPPTPPQNLVPSAPNQDEAIYVDMKELRAQLTKNETSRPAVLSPSHNDQQEDQAGSVPENTSDEDKEVPHGNAGGADPSGRYHSEEAES